MTVTFCGHREVNDPQALRQWLARTVEACVCAGADTFLLGGYGAFDRMAAGVVRQAKGKHPEVRMYLVLPYLDHKGDFSGYDGTVYPPLETVPRRYAIIHRNRWMVEQADTVIAWVTHDWGGAAATVAEARRKGRRVIQYPDEG